MYLNFFLAKTGQNFILSQQGLLLTICYMLDTHSHLSIPGKLPVPVTYRNAWNSSQMPFNAVFSTQHFNSKIASHIYFIIVHAAMNCLQVFLFWFEDNHDGDWMLFCVLLPCVEGVLMPWVLSPPLSFSLVDCNVEWCLLFSTWSFEINMCCYDQNLLLHCLIHVSCTSMRSVID